VVLFLPRAILTIPRLVIAAVFWPVQKTVRFIDRHAVVERVEDLLYFDEDKTTGIVPVFSFATGSGPTVGAKAFDDDVGGHGESAAIDARFGGRYSQAYQVSFEGDRVLGSRVWLETLARFELNPRLLFQGYGDAPEGDGVGLGPRDAAIETRYRQRRFLGLGRLGYTFGRPRGLVKLGGSAILNGREFGSTTSDDRSIEQAYDTSRIRGFDDGVQTLELDGNFILDTRDASGRTGSGLYLDAFGGAVPKVNDFGFGHAGVEITTYFNLYRRTRVLVLRLAHEAVFFDHIDDVPFSELPRLGGAKRLRGYTLDRFRDAKTAVATAEYHYPIHEYVAGALFADFGRPAPSYERLLDIADWRWGVGGGFIVRSRRTVLFSVELAYGDGVHVYFTTDPLRAFDDRGEQL
jgi:hypothetical protein